MITTIIFDIGNVLADFAWEDHYRSFGYSEEILERLADATVKSPLWNEYDRGAMSDEEIIQGFIENDPGIEKEIRETLREKGSMVIRNDYAIPWIQKLKGKGYRCLYLSNFSRSVHEQCAAALDFLPHMDGGILSYEEKVIKPMPEIYQLLIDRYGLTPEECVFLDDTQRNLDGADKFGIHTILFKNQAQAIGELKKLGVEA
ncbi:MAG: HAD family phosphatase [Lachnospiraceae bacterium]|nr:HAD family phosphatase [Lachnospiraceae bacterium]